MPSPPITDNLLILKSAVAMPGKPFVLMYRSMNGFPGIHPLGDRSKIPLTLS
jgi:hypothetical protein